MELTNDELRERLALLKTIKELQAAMPDEDEMQAARDHLATLQELDKHSERDEDEIVAASDHLATLREISDREAA